MLNVSSDFLLIVAAVFSTGWKIATSFQVPGTNLNIPEFVFACFMVVFAIKVVPHILGFNSWWGDNMGPGETLGDRVKMSFQKRTPKY